MEVQIKDITNLKQSASRMSINPIVAKAGGLQSQGVKGEAVVIYREPLTTKDLESSGFPLGKKDGIQSTRTSNSLTINSD